MKRNWIVLFLTASLIGLAACTPAAATVAPAQAPTAGAGEVVLTIAGLKDTQTYTLADLEKLPAVTGQAGIKSSTGKITLPATFKGVLLTDLLKPAGGADTSMGVQIEASDGYAMTFSYDQINQGDFITYDMATGDETKVKDPLKVIISEAKRLPADLIVLAWGGVVTKGHSAVVRGILEDAPCPLLLVRVPGHA